MSLSSLKSSQSTVSLLGKNALVVGGTSGIGKGIAIRLAQANASVTIVGRDEVNGAAIVNEMESITASSNIEASADNSPKHAFIRCDASLLSNVKICADQYKSANSHLDILVLTQGIAALDGFTPTSEGIDRKLALHYYSRVGFVKCLMPFMLATVKDAPPQVLSVLSGGVHSPYTSYRSDPSLKTSFSIKNAADAAGFYNDIAVEMFSKEYPQAVFTHSSPGLVKTNWGSDFPWYIRGMVRGAQLFFMSPEDCAEYQCANLFSPQMQKCGFYIRSPSASPASTTALHDEAKEFVWNHTNEVVDPLI